MNDTDFDTWLARAWDDHASNPEGVLARLRAEAASLINTEGRKPALLQLAHHVCGEHLGRWQEGIEVLQRLSALPAGQAAAASDPAAQRCIASLALAGGLSDLRADLSASDQVRVTAMAATSLAPHKSPRASALLQEALAMFDAAGLPSDDPCVRALAVSGNNLAATLEEKPQRSEDEVALMILAAQSARRFWALAGGWLEVERAEYRLSHSCRVAGDAAGARHHALACLEMIAANGQVPLERFFGLEALCLAEHAAGDHAARARAAAQMHGCFQQLAAGDQAWCRATLDKLPA